MLMAPEWSSSITHGTSLRRRPSTFASASARARVMEMPVGLWALGCRTTATGRDSNARFSESGRMPSASNVTGTISAPNASTRSKNGGKPGFSRTTRSP